VTCDLKEGLHNTNDLTMMPGIRYVGGKIIYIYIYIVKVSYDEIHSMGNGISSRYNGIWFYPNFQISYQHMSDNCWK